MLDGAHAHRTIHAGEADGIESIRAALDGAHAERLGHGVRIADEVADDGALGPLAQRVLDEQITLEVAPSSNVQTGAYPSLAEHPVDRLHRLGFAVTLNTDNRLMSGVSVTSEIAAVAGTFGWTWDDVATVTERAVARAFVPDAERARLLDDVIRPGYAALRGVSTATRLRESRTRSSLLTWAYRHIGRSSSRTERLGMSASVQIPRVPS